MLNLNFGPCVNVREDRSLRERVNQGWRPVEVKPCDRGRWVERDTSGRPRAIPVLLRSK